MQGDQQRLAGGLYMLRVLSKAYEFEADGAKRKPLHDMVEATFPQLVALLHAILAQAPTIALAELALLATKVMWTVTQLSLPPLLLEPDRLEPWFDVLIALLEQPLPVGAPVDPVDAMKWPPWKVKKRVAAIIHRVLQRCVLPLIALKPATSPSRRCAECACPTKPSARRWGSVEPLGAAFCGPPQVWQSKPQARRAGRLSTRPVRHELPAALLCAMPAIVPAYPRERYIMRGL